MKRLSLAGTAVASLIGCIPLVPYEHRGVTHRVALYEIEEYEETRARLELPRPGDLTATKKRCILLEGAVDSLGGPRPAPAAATSRTSHMTALDLLVLDERAECESYERSLRLEAIRLRQEVGRLGQSLRSLGASHLSIDTSQLNRVPSPDEGGRNARRGEAAVPSPPNRTRAKQNRRQLTALVRRARSYVEEFTARKRTMEEQLARRRAAAERRLQACLDEVASRESAEEEARQRRCSQTLSAVAGRVDESTFEGLMLAAASGSDDRTFLQAWFANCAGHERNEFARRRCEQRRAQFRRTAPASTWLSGVRIEPGKYDFKRQRFVMSFPGVLGDSGMAVSPGDEPRGIYDSWGDPERHIELDVRGHGITDGRPTSGPDWVGTHTAYPAFVARRTRMVIPLSPEDAEQVRRNGGFVVLSVWRPVRSWRRAFYRKHRVEGVEARVLGLQVRDPRSGRVVWSRPPSGGPTQAELEGLLGLGGSCLTQESVVTSLLDRVAAMLQPSSPIYSDGIELEPPSTAVALAKALAHPDAAELLSPFAHYSGDFPLKDIFGGAPVETPKPRRDSPPCEGEAHDVESLAR